MHCFQTQCVLLCNKNDNPKDHDNLKIAKNIDGLQCTEFPGIAYHLFVMDETPPINRLFVYGTLRREAGHRMHDRLLGTRATYLGQATVAGTLYKVSWYPAAWPASSGAKGGLIHGELYELHDSDHQWRALDRYEQARLPGSQAHAEYERRLSPVTLADSGEQAIAWVYWWIGSLQGLVCIGGGDFLATDRLA